MGRLVLQPETLSLLSPGTPGTLEYDGGELYFTSSGTQRGLVPGMQYYRLNSTVAGANATGAQNLLGVGVTLSASTVYAFELQAFMVKTAGVTSHTVNFSWGGTATVNNIYNSIFVIFASGGVNTYLTSGTMQAVVATQTTSVITTGSSNVAGLTWNATMKGTVSIGGGGTFIPQYSLSAAPGGAYTTQIGSYMLIYPIGAAGSTTNIGIWA